MSPEELAEQADKGEPEKGRWSQSEQLIAIVADRIAELVYVYGSAHAESKSKRPKAPEPIRRPGAKPVRAKQKLTDDQANTLFRIINGSAA